MDKEMLWIIFTQSGKIEDYLNYKENSDADC